MAPPLLEARELCKRFGARRRLLALPARARGAGVLAVDHLSLALSPGESLALVGESGCGKSTTARLLLGLLAPSAGAVRFDGRPLSALDRAERLAFRRSVQIVFQDPYASLNPRRSIGSAIAEPLALHGICPTRAQRRARVEELLSSVGLAADLYDRLPDELSGGQRRRVGIARALALSPQLLIADEPTVGLDLSVQAQVLSLLAQQSAQRGLGLLVISHDLAAVSHLCERVAVMEHGRIVEEGPLAQVFAAPRHPCTAALLAADPAQLSATLPEAAS
ncbi:MAG TPA: ABC transporter ATP-binding protein [Solirubrobacteraceae bacterium]|nr:ABC transporter ATP-binding protein [Solirubrobacteraceae bacterium]